MLYNNNTTQLYKTKFIKCWEKWKEEQIFNHIVLFYFVQNGRVAPIKSLLIRTSRSKRRRWFTLCIVEVLLTEKNVSSSASFLQTLQNLSWRISPTREFLKRESKRDEQTRINKAWEHSRDKSPGSSGISKKPKLRVWLENTSRVTCFTDENSFSSIQILSTLGLGLFIFILHIWSSCLSFFCIYKGKTASPEACTTETGTIYTRSLQENLV